MQPKEKILVTQQLSPGNKRSTAKSGLRTNKTSSTPTSWRTTRGLSMSSPTVGNQLSSRQQVLQETLT
ncbi:hypothetical protein EPR50_G00195490 [Perca flavescens]|uniref:Uncharacterized protein n=1 Tax=Perca flavescens TaxID=8167 RepID=A0A484C750_PERFV|nr:hypothetical protein EPR50_G00195490 [Perca flavescens]